MIYIVKIIAISLCNVVVIFHMTLWNVIYYSTNYLIVITWNLVCYKLKTFIRCGTNIHSYFTHPFKINDILEGVLTQQVVLDVNRERRILQMIVLTLISSGDEFYFWGICPHWAQDYSRDRDGKHGSKMMGGHMAQLPIHWIKQNIPRFYMGKWSRGEGWTGPVGAAQAPGRASVTVWWVKSIQLWCVCRLSWPQACTTHARLSPITLLYANPEISVNL